MLTLDKLINQAMLEFNGFITMHCFHFSSKKLIAVKKMKIIIIILNTRESYGSVYSIDQIVTVMEYCIVMQS